MTSFRCDMPGLELRLTLAALAAWRLAYMVASELGPWDVFKRLRDRLGVPYLREDGWPDSNAGRLLSCVKCMSVWTAALFGLLSLTHLWWISLPFALSAPAVFVRDKFDIPH